VVGAKPPQGPHARSMTRAKRALARGGMGFPPWGFLLARPSPASSRWPLPATARRGAPRKGGSRGGNQGGGARHALCRHKPPPTGWAGGDSVRRPRRGARRAHHRGDPARRVTRRAPLHVRRAARGGWRDDRHQLAVLAAGVTAALQARGVAGQSSP
jgi:hypothetical protein